MTYDVYSPEGRHAAAAAGANTLSDAGPDDGPDTADWDRYIAYLQEALQASSGYQRMVLEKQYEDAERGRQNAYKIARLQAETSRYGTDVNREVELARLKENARQFDANHGLEMQKLGLDYARTATDYLSTPDRYFQAGNYLNFASRVLAGQPGAAPYGSVGTPTPKTSQDFAILAGGGIPGTGQGGSAQDVANRAASAGGAGADDRVRAVQALTKALPPSAGDGLDPTDFAVLGAVHQLYNRNLTPQQYLTIEANPDLKAMTASGGRRLGYNPDQWEAQQRRNLPGQGSVRAA